MDQTGHTKDYARYNACPGPARTEKAFIGPYPILCDHPPTPFKFCLHEDAKFDSNQTDVSLSLDLSASVDLRMRLMITRFA